MTPFAVFSQNSGSTPTDAQPNKRWKGNIEGAFNFQTGNTDKQDANIATKLTYSKDVWQNILKLSANTSQESDVTQDEEYRVNNQTRYNISDTEYVFGELEYINDRFAGFESRISELFGYGRHLYSWNTLHITGEASLGARQSKLTDGSDENALLAKLLANADWKINNNLSLSQELSSAFAFDSSVISVSDTSLKSKISDSLYFKAGVNIEHIDDAPAGSKHVDTTTILGVGYDF